MTDPKPSITYKDAGVDIEAGNQLVERIKSVSKRTHRPGVMSGLGGFGACFELPSGYKQPVLVSGTDGVGTKLRLGIDHNSHDTVGIDLVAMCVNDLIVQGAEPLYFLDYFATGKLDVETAAEVITGIGKGCELAGCALTGGETAEMPGMYPEGDYDLAGFCVGIVEKEAIIDGSNIKAGDSLVALTSSGPHSNGYSLIRKIIDTQQIDIHADFEGKPLIQRLLEPTRIYVKPVLAALEATEVKGISHITGGGLTENIPRVLPNDMMAVIHQDSWSLPSIFSWLKEQGNLAHAELVRTLNCGVGMVLVVAPEQADKCMAVLREQGENPWIIGEIQARDADAASPQVIFQ